MARRRGFSQAVGTRTRRATNWGIGPGGTGITSISASSSVILGSGVALVTTDPVTIVRTRGQFDAFLTSASTPGDGYQGAIGIGIVSSPAFAIGITAMPTPLTEVEWDGWLYHRFFGAHNPKVDVSDAAGVSIEVDSKAMRKWGDAVTLFAAIEVVEIGTAVLNVFFDSRVLIKIN